MKKTEKSSSQSKTTSRSELLSLEEIFLKKVKEAKTRDDLVEDYFNLMRLSNWKALDWGKINRAIMNRWSFAALEYIKKKAWEKVEDASKKPIS